MGNLEVCVLPEKLAFGSLGMRKTFWEQRQVPAFFQKQGVDLVHFPYPANPWVGRRRWRGYFRGHFVPAVCVTVHDTIPWEDPAYRRSALTRLYQDRCRAAVKKADHVFTVSEASKKDVQRLCGVADSKISLSYNAPAAQFFEKISSDVRATVLKKYGLDPARRYFFYVGGYDERKNVRTLVEAFTRFVAPMHDVDLVLAGGKAVTGGNDKLYASFDAIANAKNIHTTGFVEEKDLPALYQSALGFVSVSTREGCNLPLLEALSSGIPVIASDIPVHHEMAGGAVTYVGAHDVERLGGLMVEMLLHPWPAQNYHCSFSWEASAKKVLEIYQQLIRR